MDAYESYFERNIGVISQEQQDKLKNSTIAVFGIGGLGGVIVEILVRSGVEKLKIIEPEKFELSNLNRHVFCYHQTMDDHKVDAAEKFLKDINPDVQIEKVMRETGDNIGDILKDVHGVVLACDKIRGVLTISRKAHEMGIPLVEGWAIPYGNVRVFTKDTPSLEEVYQLPSLGKNISDFSVEELKQMDLLMLKSLTNIEGVESYYDQEAQQRISQGKNPSFAPLVWLTAVLMSLEMIKVILNWGNVTLAPKWSVFDPFQSRIPGINGGQ